MNNMFDPSRSNESKFNGYVNYGIWKFKFNKQTMQSGWRASQFIFL